MVEQSNTWVAAKDARDRIVNLLHERDGINSDIKDLVEEAARITGHSKSHIRKAAMIEKKGRDEYNADAEVFDQLLRQLDALADVDD